MPITGANGISDSTPGTVAVKLKPGSGLNIGGHSYGGPQNVVIPAIEARHAPGTVVRSAKADLNYSAAAPLAPAVTPNGGAVGTTFACSSGSWPVAPVSFAFQWSSGGNAIPGATGSTYTAQAADVGKVLSCSVMATNGAGATSSAASNSTAAITGASS